jgi:hypothetical protein
MCAFALPEIDFLGHVVGADGVKVDPKKTAALRDWPVPTTLYDVRAFLGLAGYYRKFVHRFAHLAAPLTELTQKASTESVVDRWGLAQWQAFEELKVALTEPPVLCYPDMSLSFSLYTDSSEFAHGATLLQDQGKGLQACMLLLAQTECCGAQVWGGRIGTASCGACIQRISTISGRWGVQYFHRSPQPHPPAHANSTQQAACTLD